MLGGAVQATGQPTSIQSAVPRCVMILRNYHTLLLTFCRHQRCKSLIQRLYYDENEMPLMSAQFVK